MCSVFFKSCLALLHLAGCLPFILWRYIPLLFCSLSHDLLVLSFFRSICVPLWRTQLYLYHTIPGSSCRTLLPQARLLYIYLSDSPTSPLQLQFIGLACVQLHLYLECFFSSHKHGPPTWLKCCPMKDILSLKPMPFFSFLCSYSPFFSLF